MKRYESISLGDAMRDAIEKSAAKARLDEAQAARCWVMIVGPHIAGQSPRPSVKGGVMTVRLSSAALRQELNYRRSMLLAAINKMVGVEVLTDLRFISL